MKLAVGISFYNDVLGLGRLLDSVKDNVDKIIAIDGRYSGFDSINGSALSTDGSREVLKACDKAVLVDYPGTQIAKRNKYLILSKKYECDYMLILDADEYIKPESEGSEIPDLRTNWETFRYVAEKRVRLDLGMYRIYDLRYEEPNGWNLGERPRLWFRPWEIRYDVRHFRWIIKAKKHLDRPVYEGNAGRALIPGLVVRHWPEQVRTPERQTMMRNYEDWLIQNETKRMRKKYNLP